jgi:hypothetical protein
MVSTMSAQAPDPAALAPAGTPWRGRLARLLIAGGTVVLLLATIVVITNRTFLDTERFASSVDEIRETEAVSTALGDALTEELLRANPDLVAVRPVIEQVAATVVGSDLLSPLVRLAAEEAQKAATTPDSEQIVLRIADLGSVVGSVLQTLAPELAADVPADLSLTLASLGSQDVFGATVALAESLQAAGILLPLMALAMIAGGVWISPNQRHGLVRAGVGTMAAGAALSLLLLIGGIAVATLDESTVAGALVDSGWSVWGTDYWVAAGALVVLGALVASAAAALLPEIDVDAVLRRAAAAAGRRPSSVEGAAARGVVIVGLGLGLLLAPLRLISWAGVALGLAVLAYGISEITQAALSAKAGEPGGSLAAGPTTEDGDRRFALVAVVGTVLVALVGAVVWLTLDVSRETTTAAQPVDTCNGHVELCERPYDEVSYVTSHNAMSAADQPGWFLAEQPHGIIDQLDGGVRALMIDVWTGQPTESGVASLPGSIEEGRAQLDAAFGAEAVAAALRVAEQTSGDVVGDPALYMCHGLCEIGATELAGTLADIGQWLVNNPGEVVSIIVENHVPAEEIGAAVDEAGLLDVVYAHSDGPFPTLREMIEAEERLVVMTEEGDGGQAYPWLRNAFELTQDTPFTFPAPEDFSCEPNRGTSESPLFLINHWLSGFGSLVTDAELVNVSDVLRPRLQECQRDRGLLPTFVGVNFYSIGDVGAEVDRLNGVGS